MRVVPTIVVVLCSALVTFRRTDAQDIIPIPVNSSLLGETLEQSAAIFSRFSKTDTTNSVGLAGQKLFQFDLPAASITAPISLRISTCNSRTDFDTYLVLFAQNPFETPSANLTVLGESANDLLCRIHSVKRATIYTTLYPTSPGTPFSTITPAVSTDTYYVLLTGDGAAYGAYNLSVETSLAEQDTDSVPWHLDRVDQRFLPLNNLYSVQDRADDLFVYLIDSGVNSDHEELVDRVQVGYDFVRFTEVDTPDCTGHGTHLAGLIAGKTFGVAKGVKIISVRVYGCDHRTTTTAIINALDFVLVHSEQQGIRERSVISLMIALNETSVTTNNLLRSSVQSLLDRNLPVVVPAGDNYRRDSCTVYPGNVAPFLTVGALSASDELASFTNVGSCIDLYAPGTSIKSAWHSSNTAVVSMSGSAQAAAVASGVAALLLSLNDMLTGQNIKNILYSISTPHVIPIIQGTQQDDEDGDGFHDSARLVYVRSVGPEIRDRSEIPETGDILLKAILRVTAASCDSISTQISGLRDVIIRNLEFPEDSKGNMEENFQIECTIVDPSSPSSISPASAAVRQNSQLNLVLKLTVDERLASSKFLKLEKLLSDANKDQLQTEAGLPFLVVENTWAIDSRQVIYWGAPTFPRPAASPLNTGIIIAIAMGIAVVLAVLGAVCCISYRKRHRLDEIESMEGSGDIEKGPVHFNDFDVAPEDEDGDGSSNHSGIFSNTRSFRNLAKSFSSSFRASPASPGPVLTSLGSFAPKTGGASPEQQQRRGFTESVRLKSFGGEAFAGFRTLGSDDEDKKKAEQAKKRGLASGPSWREQSMAGGSYSAGAFGFGRINSELPADGDGDIAREHDTMVVKSMGGEAFAALAHMSSIAEIREQKAGTSGEAEEKIIREDDAIAMSPRANATDQSPRQM